MSVTYEEHIRRKWGRYSTLYSILTGKNVKSCSRSPTAHPITSADYTLEEWAANTSDTLTEFFNQTEKVNESLASMDEKALQVDLQNLLMDAERLKHLWEEKIFWIEKEVVPKIREIDNRLIHGRVMSLFQYKYDRIEYEIECATRFVEALLRRPDLRGRENIALLGVLHDLNGTRDRGSLCNFHLCIAKADFERSAASTWYFLLDVSPSHFEIACSNADFRDLRVDMLSDGTLATNYCADSHYLEAKGRAEDLALAEWRYCPLESHLGWAKEAAVDVDFEFEMMVDGVTFRKGANKLELPELYLEQREQG